MVSPRHRPVWQREWPRSAWIPRRAGSGAQGSWRPMWEPGPLNCTTPVNSQHAPGTWLGGIVHDPDESFGQEVVVGGLLGRTGCWELDSL